MAPFGFAPTAWIIYLFTSDKCIDIMITFTFWVLEITVLCVSKIPTRYWRDPFLSAIIRFTCEENLQKISKKTSAPGDIPNVVFSSIISRMRWFIVAFGFIKRNTGLLRGRTNQNSFLEHSHSILSGHFKYFFNDN